MPVHTVGRLLWTAYSSVVDEEHLITTVYYGRTFRNPNRLHSYRRLLYLPYQRIVLHLVLFKLSAVATYRTSPCIWP